MVLETEYDNAAALSLYESLGFMREKRLYRFYLNGKDAFRLVLVVTPISSSDDESAESDADSQVDEPLQIRARTGTVPLTKPMSLLVPPVPIRFFPAIPYDSDDEVSSR